VDLKKTKMSHSELGELCNYCLEKGLIVEEYRKLIITSKGIEKINKINDDLNRKGIERFIVPFNNYKIARISKDDIYLP
jgi:hypothetical protein